MNPLSGPEISKTGKAGKSDRKEKVAGGRIFKQVTMGSLKLSPWGPWTAVWKDAQLSSNSIHPWLRAAP